MKEECIKDLLDKYKAGKTSTEEELYLQNNSDALNREHKDVFNYISNSKIKAPENLNSDQWNIFELKQKHNKRNRYTILSIAASIIVVVSFLLMNPSDTEMAIEEKQALLNEAILMLDNTEEENVQAILYEDDMVIIYTSN